MAEALQVEAQAAGVLYGADGHQPGARATGGEQGAFRVGHVQRDLQHFDAEALQRFPDDPVGGKFLVADDHLIACRPIQTKGNE
ncbi:hypothetical protein D3C76_1529050 [compost metagenome]